MTKSAAQLLMERETRVRYGPVDLDRFGYAIEPGRSHLEANCYLLHTPDGLSYFYRQGEGVTIYRDDAALRSDEQLWLNGSVYSAVACINGLVPIHASAVAHDGKVFAFTGPSGAGKSTLIAALGRLGFATKCLPRAMALSWMMRHRNLVHTMVIAVRPSQMRDSPDAMHAWVEVEGERIIGDLPGPWIETLRLGA